jgi:hypothetical protein
MALTTTNANSLTGAWEVIWLFLIPVGGGIPSGVLLAKSRGLGWGITAGLYFLTDVVLACLFEPIMCAVIAAGKRQKFLAKFRVLFSRSAARTASRFGGKLSPFSLVMVSFGVDPMTGRTAAKAIGHGFVAGWAIAIAGDMMYFAVLAYSTLALNKVLNETWTTVIILASAFLVPKLVGRLRIVFRRTGHGIQPRSDSV